MKIYCLIIVFFSFFFSNSQPNKPIIGEGVFNKNAEYAELIISELNKKASFFRASFQYTTSSAPIDGEKCAKTSSICNYTMTVSQFISKMEINGWELISSSIIDGGNYKKTYKYLFRKE
tara:strand:+ start:2430 stop:2786 length:357 start_codon:yes stop_codon:yes gene_type:complete